MHITHDWQDASGGFLFADVALADHANAVGGWQRTIEARRRIAPAPPSPGDEGELFAIGTVLNRIPIGFGKRLWLKAPVKGTQFDAVVRLTNTVGETAATGDCCGIQPETYGAIGDGNPTSMAADTHGWQMAINESAATGVPVMPRAVTYIIDGHKGDNTVWTNTSEWKSGGLILRGGAQIWGRGRGKTVLKNGADRWRCIFRIRENAPVCVRDLTVDGDVGVTKRPVMLGGDGTETLTEGDVRGECFIMEGDAHIQYFELRNLEIKNSGHYGIGIQNVYVDGGLVSDCIFSNIGGDCIDVKSYPKPGNFKQGMMFRNIVSLDGAGHHYIGKYDPGEGHDDQTVVDLAEGCHLHGCFVYGLDVSGTATRVTGVRFRPASVSSPPRTGSPNASATLCRVYSTMAADTGNNDTKNVCCYESSCDGSHFSDVVGDGGYRGLAIIAGADFTPKYGSIVDAVIKNSSWNGVGEPAYGLRLGGNVNGVLGRNILIQRCRNGAKLDCTQCDVDLRIEDSTNVQLQANDAVFDQNRLKLSFGRANVTPSIGDLNPTNAPLTAANQASGVSPVAAVYGGEMSLVQSRRAYLNLISTANDGNWLTGADPDDPVIGNRIFGGIQVIGGDADGAGPGLRAGLRAKAQGPSGATTYWEFASSDGVTNDVASMQIGPFRNVSLLPFALPGFDIVDLPSAASYVASLVYLHDPVGNKRVAISDGSTWRYMDGTAV